jgi:hypothetical protein
MLGTLRTRTGNLSIEHIRAALCGRPAPDADEERAALPGLRAAGFDEVEDYVAWAVVEPEPGRPSFEHHRANAQAARRAGLDWIPFLWAHAAPDWARREPDWVPARCLEHDLPGPLPALCAEGTFRLVERFWRLAGRELAGLPSTVAIGFPADYGELGYGCGMADWLLVPFETVAHHHVGLWCGAAGARTPDLIEFGRAYRGRITRWTERLLVLARSCFPSAALELKIGHGSEALAHGVDWNGVVRAAARAGAVVRSTHSGLLPLFTRRLAALCRTHGAAFATEAPRGIATADLRRRILVDLAEGTTSWFAFPEQDARLRADLDRAMNCAGRGPARRHVAALYPRRAIDLDPGTGTAEVLGLAHDALAAVADFAVLDETQLEAGEHEPLSALIVLDRTPGFDPRAALAPWIEGGRVLILARGGAIPRYEGARAAGAAFAVEPGRDAQRLLIGAGWGGRADAAPAWGLEEPVAARWTAGRAGLLLTRPSASSGGELCCELFAEHPTQVTLWADGGRILSVALHGPGRLAGHLPAGEGPLIAVAIEATALAADPAPDAARRLLVRDVLVGSPGAEIVHAPPNPRVACDPAGPGLERVGCGLVLRGDGTPLSALAWLRTWLDGRLPVPAPAIDRDPSEQSWIASWGGARLMLATSSARE